MSTTATIARQEIPVGKWTLDRTHSKVAFEVRHMGVSTFASQFDEFDAVVNGGQQPSLEGTVNAASIEAGDEQLRGHLLSPEFFDIERHPVLRFESSSLEISDDGAASLSGVLEIKGERREVSASGRYAYQAADIAGNEKIGLTLETTVDRRDFGLDWQADLPSGDPVLEWDVAVRIALELVRAEA